MRTLVFPVTWMASTPTASPTRCAFSVRSSSFQPSILTPWRSGAPSAELFKTVKEQRRTQRRAAIRDNDEAVTAATATGAPGPHR